MAPGGPAPSGATGALRVNRALHTSHRVLHWSAPEEFEVAGHGGVGTLHLRDRRPEEAAVWT
jgi:hypothetical protein